MIQAVVVESDHGLDRGGDAHAVWAEHRHEERHDDVEVDDAATRPAVPREEGERGTDEAPVIHLGDLYAESGQTLQGSFSVGWLVGKPDYPQKLEGTGGVRKDK